MLEELSVQEPEALQYENSPRQPSGNKGGTYGQAVSRLCVFSDPITTEETVESHPSDIAAQAPRSK